MVLIDNSFVQRIVISTEFSVGIARDASYDPFISGGATLTPQSLPQPFTTSLTVQAAPNDA